MTTKTKTTKTSKTPSKTVSSKPVASAKPTTPSKNITTAKAAKPVESKTSVKTAKPVVETKPIARVRPQAAAPIARDRRVDVRTQLMSNIGQFDKTVQGITLGLRYTERLFVDNYNGVEFQMSLGDGMGTLHFTTGTDYRWGLFYMPITPANAAAGSIKLYHVEDLDMDLQSLIAQKLQAFWNVGRDEQNASISRGLLGISAMSEFARHLSGPVSGRTSSRQALPAAH